MSRINLITSDNAGLEKTLTSLGFSVNSISPGKTGTKNENHDFSIMEINEGKYLPDDKLLRETASNSRVICLSGELTPAIGELLIASGISDCLSPFTPASAAEYTASLAHPEPQVKGIFTVLDNDPCRVRMINGIVARFGYSVHNAESIEQLFLNINSNRPVMILINIGMEGLDLARLIRESYASGAIKKSPVIAYRDMREGLFVHEVISGLGKITKLILSPAELYCMLADMMFKKEIITAAAAFEHASLYGKYKNYAGLTIPQIYYEIHPDPCGIEPLLQKERTELMAGELERLKRILILSEGIRWLCNNGRNTKATCGAGA